MLTKPTVRLLLLLGAASAVFAQSPIPMEFGFRFGGGQDGFLLRRMTVDSSGNIYAAGSALQPAFRPDIVLGPGGQSDIYIIKFDSAGQRALYATVIGGSGYDALEAIAVDASGQVWLSGTSTSQDFPAQGVNGVAQAFVIRLSSDGQRIVQATLFGGVGTHPRAIAPDRTGGAYVAGATPVAQFSATPGAFQTAASIPQPGPDKGFVMHIEADGRIAAATFLAGSRMDEVRGIAITAGRQPVVTGVSHSPDFPVTPGAYRAGSSDPFAAFVSVLAPDLSALLHSTRSDLGDDFQSIALDAAGNIYVAGGQYSITIAKFSAAADRLLYRRQFAPSLGATASELAARPDGTVFLVGWTNSPDLPTRNSLSFCALNLPTVVEPAVVALLMQWSPAGEMVHSTFMGGPAFTSAQAVALDGAGRVIIAGSTGDSQFPAAREIAAGGVGRAWILKLDPDRLPAGRVAPACLVHGAMFNYAPISPGSIMTIFGSNLGPSSGLVAQPVNGRYGSELSGTQVTVDGVFAAMLYASDTQINFVVPWEISEGAQKRRVCVSRGGAEQCLYANATAVAPGIFTDAERRAAALNQDGSINSAGNRAPRGSVVALFLTGTGALDKSVGNGEVIPASGAPRLVRAVSTEFVETIFQSCWHGSCPPIINRYPAEVLYAGAAPALVAGVTQINVRVPATAPVGPNVSLAVRVSGAAPVSGSIGISPEP